MIGQVSIAAASATVDTDLFRDKTWRIAATARQLRGMAVAGSAAAGDTVLQLFVDQHLIGDFHNLATGFPTRDHIVPLPGNYVPAGATVACIVKDAPATNPINVILY